jgi:GTP-binding protein LepA
MMHLNQKNIRNFSIIAHIDHGKSTLADRLIEMTGMITKREMQEQVLDKMDLERERGITIKLKAVRLIYKAKDGIEYILNLIDTPGHVDFNYEVSRSLAACEGAILVVDATQGVEAQTLANVYLALDQNLEILPVINKIDLPSARAEEVKTEIEDIIGIEAQDAPMISAKDGINIEQVLEEIVKKVPAPQGDTKAPLKALIFDSYYDSYKGVTCYIRVFEGRVSAGMNVKMMATGKEFEVTEVGVNTSKHVPLESIGPGEVGYLTASIKNVKEARVGDTITETLNPTKQALPGYKKVIPMVYSGIYPAEGEDFNTVREALEKLQVNDGALIFEPETSVALGFGFRCGFLGLLHMEIIQERLEREFDLTIITTAPSVIYKVTKTNGEVLEIQNPSNLPPTTEIASMKEPIVSASIMTPTEYVGSIMELCQNKRGVFKDMKYLEETRVVLNYELPLNEVIYDFFDALKSKTRGYASFDY